VTVRHDVFKIKKDIHIKLDKNVHIAMRMKVMELGITMQDVFNEFARMVIEGNSSAVKIVEKIVAKKVAEELNGNKKTGLETISERDHDLLYDLIDGSSIDEKDET
jgi:uncharacterized membrane protein